MKSFEEVMQVTRHISGPAAFENAECRAYYDLLTKLPYGATVLEIGLQFGRSSSIIMQLQREMNFRYLAVDPWVDPPEACREWVNLLIQLQAQAVLYCMRTVDYMLQGTYPRWPPIDLCLIDGDHLEEAVALDIHAVRPYIRTGGYLCFHDFGRASLPGVFAAVHSTRWDPEEWQELPAVGTLGIWRRQ